MGQQTPADSKIMAIFSSTTVSKISAMDDAQLRAMAWTLLTNRRSCGGGSIKGRALAQRRVRAMGAKFYFILGDGWSQWGIVWPGEGIPATGDELVVVGVSLDHCAHQFGGGNASVGWKAFHNCC